MERSDSPVDIEARRKGIRRTTIVMAGIALCFYVGFILMGVLNA